MAGTGVDPARQANLSSPILRAGWLKPVLRDPVAIIAVASGLALLLALFGGVLFLGQQFGFRDAAHYYYPLHQRVQQEWDAGRLPLWSAEENAGMPLLGNPTAAVLYPGKLVFAVLSYPWAARVYPIVHVVLAAVAMFGLLRHWRVSVTGSSLGALSYGFGAPVLFQYCNIIYLVGAAWLPVGFLGADRWVREGRRSGLVILALVLAFQTLGGDPEVAYVLGVCAAGYAAALSLRSHRPSRRRSRRWLWFVLGGGLLVVWVAATLSAEWWLGPGPGAAPVSPFGPPPGPRIRWLTVGNWRKALLASWAVVGLTILVTSVRLRRPAMLKRLTGLVGAAVLAVLLIGMQLLPVLEFTRLSLRAAEDGSHGFFPFSLEPHRLVELFWTGPFGSPLVGNRSWLMTLPPHHLWRFWVPSLYVGGLAIVLAVAVMTLRHGPSPRAWLTVVGVVSLLAAMGEFAGPLWIARNDPYLVEHLGPHDPNDFGEHRRDGHLPDGLGSPYWLMAQLLPGFDGFRYPSKLLTFTSLAIAGLAGFGWDAATAGRLRRGAWIAAGLAMLSVGLLAAAAWNREALLDFWQRQIGQMGVFAANTFGPFDPESAYDETLRALGQGAVVMLMAAVVIGVARRLPMAAGIAAIVLMTIDLGLAGRDLVMTVPQALFETEPEALRVIREAERDDPSPGPYRVHRMPLWEPSKWHKEKAGRRRVEELVAWERATIQPKYGLPFGVEYTVTEGVGELYDYWFFFAPFYGANADDDPARLVGLPPGTRVVYFPRRGFDLWGTRYFVIPRLPANDERRGFFSFLPFSRLIYPRDDQFRGPDAEKAVMQWNFDHDWQVLRNDQAYPRAWVVHSARVWKPIRDMRRDSREPIMEELLYQADDLWSSPSRTLWDPRRWAWIETEEPATLQPFHTGGPTGPDEVVTVVSEHPQRVELEAVLDRPGFVVLADVLYPGWTLTIDGQPAPILRANRVMRGAAVPAGRHRLVYRYEPRSVRVGAALSLAGLVGLAGACLWSRGRRAAWGEGEELGPKGIDPPQVA